MKKGFVLLIALVVILVLYLVFRSTSEVYNTLPSGGQTLPVTKEFGGWIKFSAPSGLFDATFPTVPQFTTDVTRDAIGIIERTNEIYVSEQENGTIYFISVVRYHRDDGTLPLSDEQMMSNVMYEMINSKPENQLLGFKKNKVLSNPGLEFTIINKDIQANTQVFTSKNDLYILSYISNIAFYDDHNFDHFVKSLKIKE